MNQGGTTDWLINRRVSQAAADNIFPTFPAIEISRDLVPTAVRAWVGIVPSGVLLGMILLGALAICATVIIRTRTELRDSVLQYQHMASDVNATQRANAALRLDIQRITTDPAMIESAARTRLGMVRPDDIVVPVQLIGSASNMNKLSSVR